jgi:hypothetical protein
MESELGGGGDWRPFLFFGELSSVPESRDLWGEILQDIVDASRWKLSGDEGA